jgi:hypothetical protein
MYVCSNMGRHHGDKILMKSNRPFGKQPYRREAFESTIPPVISTNKLLVDLRLRKLNAAPDRKNRDRK